ncbi:MAG: BamA/TamA family outer membrane protein [Chitinophagales bacterium]
MQLFRKVFILLFFPVAFCSAQQAKITQRIFLVGDAGETQNGKHPVCDWLKEHVDWNDSSNVLVYLGDNIYPEGMPDGGKKYDIAKAIIDYQLSVVKDKKAKAFFVPGNHDWKRGKAGGWEQVKNEEYYLNSLDWPNVQAYPTNGCPGPVAVELNDQVVLVFMDSQWWLQKGEKPGLESDCDCKSEDEVITALKDILGTYPDKLVITLMHHPLYTHGHHGGYFTLKQHIFPLTDVSPGLYIPLPVIGSIYPITRGWFGNIQDVKHPQYKNFISKVEDALKQHPNVIDAAGHDHNLQLLQHDSITYIVSGAGSKTVQVKKGKYSLFAKSTLGFAVIEVSSDGKVDVKFYTPESKDLSQSIYASSLKPVPPPQKILATNEKLSAPDSMTIIGATNLKAGAFKKMLMGSNYRKEWAEPIRIPVIDMSKELGGLTPLKRGGGHETKSLRVEDASGKQYVLRNVTKNVTDAALPPELRGTFAKDIISDGVSASYPYAALSIPMFATAAGVPHATPRLVYVADDPKLGKFRKDFANKAYFIEEREPAGYKKGLSTDEMVDQLRKDNDNSIDQKAFLNARLLDMFVMDFDRHEGQWQWTDVEKGGGKKFVAIPKDRDQPFFISKGLIASIARQNWLSPQIQGFRPHAKNIKTYNFNAKNVDHTFLSELNEDDWKKAVDEFLPKMTDELIEKALDQQPPEIKKLIAKNQIVAKLKERKKYFAAEMMTYYRFLAKTVSIAGSDKKEQFEITRNNDGSVQVVVRKINKDGEVKGKLYERKFDPTVTKEIRLYGLGGDDKFIMNGSGGKIKIRIIGGSGNDTYESNASSSAGKTLVYDLSEDSTEHNEFTGKDNFRKKLSSKPAVNDYQWKSFKYNTRMPALAISYNPDDGVFLGESVRFTRQGFRKSPYAQVHQFSVTHSLATQAYSFKYFGEFVDAIGKTDILLNAHIKAPNNTTNFFSFGNESVYDKTQSLKIKYYRARYQTGEFSILLKHKIGSAVSFIWGPLYQYSRFDSADNKNRYILMAPANGLDPATFYKNKSWGGGQLTLSIDDRDNKLMPARGINWQTTLRVLNGIDQFSNNLTQLNSDLALYTSFSKNAGFVLATRFGAGMNFNNNFEFFQAQTLGSIENLRGYRKNRFAGKSMAYNNTEMRIRIAEFKTYLFPGSIGLLFFNDIGRVWVKNDTSSVWHDGYGAGLWFSPLHRLAITASFTTSKENTLPLVSLGWQF